MHLESGLRISVLPHFRPTLLTRAELSVNSGCERWQNCFRARPDWRSPNQEELQILTEPVGNAKESQSDRIELLEIPVHLHKQWRATARKLATDPGNRFREYERFVASLASFFRFKKVAVENCSFTVMAAETPHQSAFTRLGMHGGLEIGSPEEGPLLAINLGNEPTPLVLLNLPIRRMRELLAARGFTEESPSRTPDQFMKLFPDYPLVRLALPARHGVHFCPDALIHHGYSAKKNEPDILLLITRAPTSIS